MKVKAKPAQSKKKPVLKNISKPDAVSHEFPIVAIGASAGGLEAFIQVLTKMPEDTGMAFVLIQHLVPDHPSLSSEIISRSTRLKIAEAKDRTVVRSNHIYIIPPSFNMGIENGVLKLTPRQKGPSQNTAIDLFFFALAQSEKRRAIGVVLSGTGTDGTKGLGAIQAEGGVTFAQDPKSAKFSGMPESAIGAGVVDLILKPDEITRELIRVAKHPYLIAEEKKTRKTKIAVDETDLEAQDGPTKRNLKIIFKTLLLETKVDFSGYKQSTLQRRIHRRMIVQKAKSLSDYAKYLTAHPEEAKALYNDILINVTEFFRDPDDYQEFRTQVLPDLIKNRSPGKPIRIWVAGCSTGEEVYSIAICLIEFLGKSVDQHSIQIFATDISEHALQKARAGIYSESLVQNLSKERLEKFFEKVDGGYKIEKSIRDRCLFSLHDMTSDPPFAKLDLISCHNVLIYFGADLQKQVIPIFHYALLPKGFLWLGKSENPGGYTKLFSLVSKNQKIYSRSNVPTPMNFHFPRKALEESWAPNKKNLLARPLESDFRGDADKLILSQFAPPSVVISSDHEVLQFRGRTAPYLEHAVGQPSFNLLKMVRPELLVSLRSTIQTAKNDNVATAKLGLHFESEGKSRTVDIEVFPTNPRVPAKDRTYLVLFKEHPGSTTVKSRSKKPIKKVAKKQSDSRDQQILDLITELSDLKEYQQSLVEQYEAANEELQSANEEMHSANEEFQSTNEEIETAKEELQSTNEELITVNEELRTRNLDLVTLSSDLNNLLASIEIPVVIVGADRRVRRFSPKAKSSFNLIPSDLGRPIGDIKPNFDLNLNDLVEDVVETLRPREIEIQDYSGTWLRIQIRPYKTVENKIDGAIIALIDINLLKQKELQAKESLDYNTSVAETVPLPLAVVNHTMQFQSANRAFYNYFQTPQEIEGKDIFSVISLSRDSTDTLREVFYKALSDNIQFTDFEISCEVPRLGSRILLLTGGKINWTDDEKAAALISFVDVTTQRRLESEREQLLLREQEARSQAEKANQAKDVFLATLSHELRTPLSSILTWAQLISQGKVNAEQTIRGAMVIEQSAKAQSQLIDDLLDISRIIVGKLAIEIKAVDPCVVLHSAIESVQPIAEKKLVRFETDFCRENTTLIHVDPVRLQQIVWNLLTNAIKFSPKNGVIKVELKNIEMEHRQFIEIKVSDQGKGIPAEFLPHIFNRFSQADSASTRLHGGLGLGLSIVQNLVRLQNGTVTVENAKQGTGAIFTVTFPLISLENSAIVQTASGRASDLSIDKSSTSTAQPNLAGMKILFADDDENTREAIAIYLRSFGAEVKPVDSASDAFKELPLFQPDIFVSDIAMPIEDGYSLIKRIRRLDETKGGTVPAIALSAFATADDSKHALTAGFDAHIAKPVEANALGQLILRLTKQVAKPSPAD